MRRIELGRIVGVFADVHGAHGTLGWALEDCREAGVETVALLGDLFDRLEQADPCAGALAGWPVVGVYGNHEREAALAAAAGRVSLRAETVGLLSALRERVVVGEVCLLHEVASWERHDPGARFFGRGGQMKGVFELPGMTNPEARKQFRKEIVPGDQWTKVRCGINCVSTPR